MQVVCDASVVVKWFHSDGEAEVEQARLLLAAHLDNRLRARVLDLTFYELGNTLLRRAPGNAPDIADRLDDLALLLGEPMRIDVELGGIAAVLAVRHGLSYYDAAYLGAAVISEAPLISADQDLLATGLAMTPSQAASSFNL